MRGIVLFRRDLRVDDHPALTTARKECDEVLPLFVFADPLLRSHEFGPACVNFMLGCLNDLQTSLPKLELAANNRNWQWCASTGTDAMPSSRIINPVLQSKKFDPEGLYIHR